MVRDPHPEVARLFRHDLADAAQADDPQLPISNLGADHEIEREPFPFASPDHAIAFHDAAGDRQNQRQRHVGGRFGQHVGRVRQDDALRSRVWHVEVVVTNGHVRHDLEIATGVDDLLVDLVEGSDDERLLAFDARDELVSGEDAAAEDLDLADRFERSDRGRRQLVGDENRGPAPS